MKRRILAALLCGLMAVGCVQPAWAADPKSPEEEAVAVVTAGDAATQANNNDTEYDPASWDYDKYLSGKQPKVAVKAVDDVTNTLTVHVTAVDASSREEVPVQGATVTLRSGKKRVEANSKTDADGNAVISLEDLTRTQRRRAKISAYKTIAQGTGLLESQDSGRATLYDSYPKDADGNAIRYQMQLRSENLDANGNWEGTSIPSTVSNQVDMVFAIDATGSMGSYINGVKDNVSTLAQKLIDRGLDIRFAFIEYRDITEGEPMKLLEANGSPWCTNMDTIVKILSGISADGGGDNPETTVDALGMVADAGTMKWRSSANRFAFVLTDAGTKTDNNYGYADLADVTAALKNQNITTSVITDASYKSTYQEVYEQTGGIFADISSSNFGNEMTALAENVLTTLSGSMTVQLHEPRMLANLSVCYLAENKKAQTEEYKKGVKQMLNLYAQNLAQATDGHVLIDNILLFSTPQLEDFYNTSNNAAKADIRIESQENSWGRIHSNAHVNGFYFGSQVDVTSDMIDLFNGWAQYFKGAGKLNGKKTYCRIQLSGTEGAGWNNSMLDEAAAYATTVTHETGHYLMGFFDEYMDANGKNWDKKNRPYANFGLMDGQHEDIEISKANIDYAYRGGNFSQGVDTYHSAQYHQSCEGTLASLLDGDGEVGQLLLQNSGEKYVMDYTEVSGNRDRTVSYEDAKLKDSDYIQPSAARAASVDEAVEAERTTETLAQMTAALTEDGVTLSLTPQETDAAYHLYVQNGEGYQETELTEQDSGWTANVNTEPDSQMGVRVMAERDGTMRYNQYYIDCSPSTTDGYAYVSMDNAVQAYTVPESETVYTYIADSTEYTNGEYQSVNAATHLLTKDGTALKEGKIFSVASCTGDLDYTSLSWFRYADGAWTKLDTEYQQEEGNNVGAAAAITGDGIYVLMAKPASNQAAKQLTNVQYAASADKDGMITVSFDDPNENSKYYRVYYSESEFRTPDAENVVARTYPADSTELTVDLLNRDRSVYLAVQAVQEDGSKSELSTMLPVQTEAADKDGDGIPDWYCDQYSLWPADGTEKNIAESDDDGDGLTNLEEYQGGTDPLDPNDPVRTDKIAVGGVELAPTSLTMKSGETRTVTASITPADADNQNVEWSVGNTDIAAIQTDGKNCTVTAVGDGTTTIYVKTADGGFAAECEVTVASHVHVYQEQVVRRASPEQTGLVRWVCECGDIERESKIASPHLAELYTTEYTYSGRAKHPKVMIVTDTDGILIDETSYTVIVPPNKNVGRYEVTVALDDDYYTGTLTAPFTIRPRATDLISLSSRSRGFYARWSKRTTQTSGYQLQYWPKNGAKKTLTISGTKNRSKTVSKLSRNKNYSVRVRTYKNKQGVRYYSTWSKTYRIKTK